MDTFLHVIPAGVLSCKFQGSYKDVVSRVHWFEAQGAEYRQVVVTDDNQEQLVGLPPAEAVRGILVEYTHYASIVTVLRKRYPKAFCAVRSHNIEPLQHFEQRGWRPVRRLPWVLYGTWRRFRQDITCKRQADVIYSISEYENRIYWNKLPGGARVEWLPYFCPDHLTSQVALPYVSRRCIGCLPGTVTHKRAWDTAVRFIRFAEAMKECGSSFDFVLTGDLRGSGLPASSAVMYVGMIDDLASFLGALRAVAVLSPVGYGFKTTTLDAVAAGARVLAHPTVVYRCPPVLQPALIAVETKRLDRAGDVEVILRALETDVALPEVNRGLRKRNLELLARDFGGDAGLCTPGRSENSI
jgi:hypothetical protein